MQFNRFKAEIISISRPPLQLPEFNKPIDKTFVFSRNRIFFTQEQKEMHLRLEPPSDKHATSDFKHGMKYTFDKAYDNNDNLRFQISVGNNNYSSYLRIDWWNKFLCNVIHERYIISRDWFYRTLVTAAIGFLFAIIGNMIGYRQGYQSGLKEGKAQTQDTIPRP